MSKYKKVYSRGGEFLTYDLRGITMEQFRAENLSSLEGVPSGITLIHQTPGGIRLPTPASENPYIKNSAVCQGISLKGTLIFQVG